MIASLYGVLEGLDLGLCSGISETWRSGFVLATMHLHSVFIVSVP